MSEPIAKETATHANIISARPFRPRIKCPPPGTSQAKIRVSHGERRGFSSSAEAEDAGIIFILAICAHCILFGRRRMLYNEVLTHLADVAELADALDSGSSAGNGVEVQVLSSAPNKTGSTQLMGASEPEAYLRTAISDICSISG